MTDAATLAREHWREGGITDEQAERLGFRVLEPAATLAIGRGWPAVPALGIPYWDLSGRQTEFFRVRFLAPVPGWGPRDAKPQRYRQPTGTLSEAYIPPLLDWMAVAADPQVPVAITEGEKKAAVACAMGVPTIGLGGVDMWRSTRRGVPLLPPLDKIRWAGRDVWVVFDSDVRTKPQVVRAQHALASALISLGARPSLVMLPDGPGGSKQGLDDYLIAHGIEALRALLAEALPHPEALALWELSNELLYVRDPGMVLVRETGQHLDPRAFVSHAYSNRKHLSQKISGVGVKSELRSTARHWLDWEHRAEVERVTYAPGQPALSVLDSGEYNLWPGWGVEPEYGDVGPWEWLLDHLFGEKVVEREWFERWCAYPIQHPGAKLYSAAVMWSQAKGVGKTFVAYILKAIYGRNAIEIRNRDLKAGFNSWAANKQFVIGDEITGGNARVDADYLKGIVTQHEVRVNEKFKPEYVVPDHCNYLFCSNHPDAVFLEDGDRRFFVHEVTTGAAEREKYERLHAWFNGRGPSFLMARLLELPMMGWNPREHALNTQAKVQMVADAMSDVAAWVRQLLDNPAHVLRPLGEAIAQRCDLFTATELCRAYDPEMRGRVTPPGIGRELAKAGIRAYREGVPVATKTKGVQRLYPIRRAEYWRQIAPGEAAKHYDQFRTD